jgi:ComF family protein
MFTLLSDILKNFINLAIPNYCLNCYTPLGFSKSPICDKCWDEKIRNLYPFCEKCGRSLKDIAHFENNCKSCLLNEKKYWFDSAYYCFVYQGIIKKCIEEFKYKQKLSLLDLICNEMVNFANKYILPNHQIDFIIPIPMHIKKLKEREYNQSELIAMHIAKRINKPLKNNIIKKIKYNRPQMKLSAFERKRNIKGVFKINNKNISLFGRKNILLIDDVMTTGSTFNECALILKKQEVKEVIAFAFARGLSKW